MAARDALELRDMAAAQDLRNRVIAPEPGIFWAGLQQDWDKAAQAADVAKVTDRRGMWACPTCKDGILTIESNVQCRDCTLTHRGWEV